jgi:hypothetical protein
MSTKWFNPSTGAWETKEERDANRWRIVETAGIIGHRMQPAHIEKVLPVEDNRIPSVFKTPFWSAEAMAERRKPILRKIFLEMLEESRKYFNGEIPSRPASDRDGGN